MTLSDVAIERPVLTWMLVIALATFGVLGYLRTGVDQYPADADGAARARLARSQLVCTGVGLARTGVGRAHTPSNSPPHVFMIDLLSTGLESAS